VLSSWNGIRPLVRDPKMKNTESIVRSHLVHVDADSGLVTVTGGKWTTYRQMAEDTIDTCIKSANLKPQVRSSQTRSVRLIGSHNWNPQLASTLRTEFSLPADVAQHLSQTYGDKSFDLLRSSSVESRRQLVNGYPYIGAEIEYSCRHEYCERAVDFLARRIRLAFLNKKATLETLPAVLQKMAEVHRWSPQRVDEERTEAMRFLGTFVSGSV